MNIQERTLLWVVGFWSLGEGMLGPLFAVFTERIGGDIFDITWAWAAYLITLGVLLIVTGRLADRTTQRGRAKIVAGGLFLSSLFTFGYLLVSAPVHLFVVQVGIGIATALSTPSWDSLYDQYSGQGRTDAYVWGLAEGWINITRGVAIVIGGFIVAYFSFAALFLAMGSVQLIAALTQLRLVRRIPRALDRDSL